MSFDLSRLGAKLLKYREQFQLSIDELAQGTGIAPQLLRAYEAGTQEPSGDEILILADYYRCDFKFFISNEQLAPFERTELLFRKHGGRLSKADRWSIQEFLFLCECESDLMAILSRRAQVEFVYHPAGNYFKGHGENAAAEFREVIGYSAEIPTRTDIFQDLRRIGIHVFRRKLENSSISGLFVNHPVAGRCILVNYDEDVYRQRFTAAHETGHALFDEGAGFNVSFEDDDRRQLVEVRANAFASHYLLPREVLRRNIPPTAHWDDDQVRNVCHQLQVNAQTLAIALEGADIVTEEQSRFIRSVRMPRDAKIDPELPGELSAKSLERRKRMLQRGLSSHYVGLCFDAYSQQLVTRGRVAEMLLVHETELAEIAQLYKRELN